MQFTAVIEKTSTGYSAYIPDLPGCVAAAPTISDVERLLSEAAALYLDEIRTGGAAVPQSSTVATVITVPA